MQIVLLAVGVLLVGFGAYVLLKFPDRPGGKLAFRGVTVSSKGAGLPIIVLGVVAIATSVVTTNPNPGAETGTTTAQDTTTRPRLTDNPARPTAPPSEATDPVNVALKKYPCLSDHLAGNPPVERAATKTLAMGRTTPIRSQPEALFLTAERSGALLAVVRLEFDNQPLDSLDWKVLVSDLVDTACKPVKYAYYDAARTGEDHYGRSVLTWKLGNRSYQLDFDHAAHAADATFRAAAEPPVSAAELGACLNAYLKDGRQVTFREKLEADRPMGLTVAATALFLYEDGDLLGMARVQYPALAKRLATFELVDTTCKPVRHELSDQQDRAFGRSTATFSLAGQSYRLAFDHSGSGTEATFTAVR